MEKLTNEQIKNFLENEALYVLRKFKRQKGLFETSLSIREIDGYCKKCTRERPFQDIRPRGGGAGLPQVRLQTGKTFFEFTCASCKQSKMEFFVNQEVSDEFVVMQKIGEFPRKNLERNPMLAKFFAEDAKNYEKALVCLKIGYGIGAFAYFRRVIENNIVKLLSMVEEDISNSEIDDSNLMEALTELKKDSPMKNKIEVANNALPDYLVPNGLNPLGRLYGLLSDGIHSLSDEECLEKAEIAKECIKFLISELASRKKNREGFSKLVGKL